MVGGGGGEGGRNILLLLHVREHAIKTIVRVAFDPCLLLLRDAKRNAYVALCSQPS